VGRLTRVEHIGGGITEYGYDENGNRTSITSQGVTQTAAFDEQDRIEHLGSTTYTFDANGALSEKRAPAGTTHYRYDLRGNLRELTRPDGRVIAYSTDGLDRRVARSVDGVATSQWLYADALRPIAELDANGNLVSHFVYGARLNVPDLIVRGGRTYRIVSDLVGSPRLVIDTHSGEVVQRLDYDPLGRVLRDTNPGFQPFGFAGGLYDPDTVLVRFGARDYDAETGRFTQKDPAQFGGGSNFYAYAANDPINYVDPAGESPILVAILVGAGIGAFENAALSFATQALSRGCVDWGEVGREAAVGGLFGAALGGVAGGMIARGPTTLDSSAIRFSQSSVNGVDAITASMRANGWVGAPVDVVSFQGRLITLDNTRVLAAQLTNTPVRAAIHGAGEALPSSMAGRFGSARTWGEAVKVRIAKQNAAYRAANPLGSWFIGAIP
jgi:RHS repeat-associated protein